MNLDWSEMPLLIKTQMDLMIIMIKIKNFNFLMSVVSLLLVLSIPNAFAEDLQINEVCINDILTLTISDSDDVPINDISAYIYRDLSMKKFSDTVVSDKDGKIKIKFSDQTTMMKITKEDHEDIIKNLACNEEFRAQSVEVFSVVDSSIGIIEDHETGLTVVDLGTFYGIAGNGTIPDEIEVYRDNILWKSTTKDTGIAPSTSHSEWQLPQTFFFNELPGRYKLVLITNNTETLNYEFMVKQITQIQENNSGLNLDNMVKEEQDMVANSHMSPLKQTAAGIPPENITCKKEFQLVFKNSNNIPVCVKSATVEKLIERGWIKH